MTGVGAFRGMLGEVSFSSCMGGRLLEYSGEKGWKL